MNLPNYKLLATNYYQRGFTLAEMLVVTAVIGILLTVILGSQSRYSEKLNLKNQAYNLVLKLRQAQINSLGVVSTTTAGVQNFNVSYGISFPILAPATFNFFVDRNFNGRYDSSELFDTTTFGNGVSVNRFCGTNSGVEDCSTPQLRTIEVTYRRPNPSAVLQFFNPGGSVIPSLSAPARIELRSSSGVATTSVLIDSTGQISIQ